MTEEVYPEWVNTDDDDELVTHIVAKAMKSVFFCNPFEHPLVSSFVTVK